MLLLFARTVLLLAQMLRAFVEMLLTDREALFLWQQTTKTLFSWWAMIRNLDDEL